MSSETSGLLSVTGGCQVEDSCFSGNTFDFLVGLAAGSPGQCLFRRCAFDESSILATVVPLEIESCEFLPGITVSLTPDRCPVATPPAGPDSPTFQRSRLLQQTAAPPETQRLDASDEFRRSAWLTASMRPPASAEFSTPIEVLLTPHFTGFTDVYRLRRILAVGIAFMFFMT
jgi:hypothetical protein